MTDHRRRAQAEERNALLERSARTGEYIRRIEELNRVLGLRVGDRLIRDAYNTPLICGHNLRGVPREQLKFYYGGFLEDE